MITFFVILNVIFSLLNFLLLVSFSKIAADVIESLQETNNLAPKNRAIEEPGLLDLDMSRPNYTGLPIRLDR